MANFTVAFNAAPTRGGPPDALEIDLLRRHLFQGRARPLLLSLGGAENGAASGLLSLALPDVVAKCAAITRQSPPSSAAFVVPPLVARLLATVAVPPARDPSRLSHHGVVLLFRRGIFG